MDRPILDIKKEFHVDEHGDDNSMKEGIPVPSDTVLMQNDYNTHNDLPDIPHLPEKDHAFPDYLQEEQVHVTEMDIDGQRGNIPGLALETAEVLNSQFLSGCNWTNTSKDNHNYAVIKIEESNSLPNVSETVIKSEEPSDFSPTQTEQNSPLLSKTKKTVADFHPGTVVDQLDCNQMKGNEFSDCDDLKKPVIQMIPESLNRKVDKLASSSSQVFRDIDTEQELPPLFLVTISGKNSVGHENIETSVKREADDKTHNSESSVVYPSSNCHDDHHKPCSMISGQISLSENRSVFVSSEKQKNTDLVSPNNYTSCSAVASNISDQVASYRNKDDTFTHDNEFSLVIDNAESDTVIKGKEAMDKVKKSQFIFATSRLKCEATYCGEKRCSSTPTSLPSERFEEGSASNMSEKIKTSAGESSVSMKIDSHPDQTCKATFSTESNQQMHTRLEHDCAGWRINPKEGNLEHSLKEDENIGTSVNLETQPGDQSVNGKQMDGHVVKPMDLNDSETLKCRKYEQSVLSDENVELSSEPGHLHKHTVTGAKEKHFKCDECGRYLSGKGTLKAHMRTHTGEKPFKCGKCNKCFGLKASLIDHMRTHTGEKPFKCGTCNRCFSYSKALQVHMRIHTGEKPFKCDECGKGFTVNEHLQTHIRKHTGEKPFKCSECGKCFSESGSLRGHMRNHAGEKPFTCNECGMCFGGSGSLHAHMRTHTGEKPFKCDECGKCFNVKSNLQRHVRTHTGIKPFKCDVCGKCLSGKEVLEGHMRTHTGEKPFKCGKCDKSFSHKGGLRVHMRTHTGEKPFECVICGRCFSHKGGLDAHMRAHTGEKSFKCDECGKSFRHDGSLRTHMRAHTGEKSVDVMNVGSDES